MAYFLFEDFSHIDLRPFTLTRPVYDLRVGMLTFKERWEKVISGKVVGFASGYLGTDNPIPMSDKDAIWINGKIAPDETVLRLITDCEPHSFWVSGAEVLIGKFSPDLLPKGYNGFISPDFLESLGLKRNSLDWDGLAIRVRSDIFQKNKSFIMNDFDLLVKTEKQGKISDKYTRIYGADNLFVSEGADAKAAIINAEDGPIYLGKGAQLQEGSILIGAHGICEYAGLAVGAKLRGDSTVGPYSKAGGEVSNSVIMGYSNKPHEGYLGNSVIGHWCNLGAGTNTSNLKNNYTEVKSWNYRNESFEPSGTQFCGLAIGDHSKCGIDTMLNSGTVIGVSANVFGGGYQPKFIPSFSWGMEGVTYELGKALEVAKVVMARRNLELTPHDQSIFEETFRITAKYRKS